MERRSLAWRSLAVPAAVLELLIEQADEQAVDLGAEIGACTENSAIDTCLGLAVEEWPAVKLPPGDPVLHEADRSADSLAGRIRAKSLQQCERIGGGHPAVILVVAPITVWCLKGEEPRAPAFKSNARPLGRDDLVWLVGEVAHGLPTDRRIGIEQPPRDSLAACHARLRL
ncbi:MAG TPA: hypothetical protein VLD66_06925 [Methyloceanibacter sp.]|nr:hypothetical protein [Methyloceanibacter sp.]